MVNLTPGVTYGGVVIAGDRLHNGHDYYPLKLNKAAGLAVDVGKVLFPDPADDGNLRLATTGDRGPFFICREAAVAGDLRVHVWHDDMNWLLVHIGAACKPNTLLVPLNGDAVPIGADITSGIIGMFFGIPDDEADIVSGDVSQGELAEAGLGVVKMWNQIRLPTA